MARPRKIIEQQATQSTVDLPTPAQSMAMRIWSNQSVSLSRKQRIARIESALDGHGFAIDEIKAVEYP